METQETQQEFQEEHTAAAEASASAEEQPSLAATSTQ